MFLLLVHFKGARTYCIINEWNWPAAKKYNRQKLKKKLFLCVQEWDFDCYPVVDSTTLSCLIVKTLCEVVCDTNKLLSVDFQR